MVVVNQTTRWRSRHTPSSLWENSDQSQLDFTIAQRKRSIKQRDHFSAEVLKNMAATPLQVVGCVGNKKKKWRCFDGVKGEESDRLGGNPLTPFPRLFAGTSSVPGRQYHLLAGWQAEKESESGWAAGWGNWVTCCLQQRCASSCLPRWVNVSPGQHRGRCVTLKLSCLS